MLFTCDAGNTNIKFAIYDGLEMKAFDIFESKSQEFKSLIMSFLYKANIREDSIDDSIISSVVPSITNSLIDAMKEIFNKEPIQINSSNHPGIEISDSVEDEVGADILVMCSYAYSKYQKEMLVVSLGTATVISHINEKGEFEHCAIAPGFLAMESSLYKNTDLLPDVKVKKHNSLLVSNTIDAINVGVVDGYIGMVNYLISEIKKEIGKDLTVIGCGGVGVDASEYINFDAFSVDFVTEGLNYIYMRYFK